MLLYHIIEYYSVFNKRSTSTWVNTDDALGTLLSLKSWLPVPSTQTEMERVEWWLLVLRERRNFLFNGYNNIQQQMTESQRQSLLLTIV